MLNIKKLTRGFTMIELLIVIAVLGILAVAVLSAINPIEQINRGRDTSSKSDAEQLLSAIDRYNAMRELWPWQNVSSDEDSLSWTQVTATTPAGTGGNGCSMLDNLAADPNNSNCPGTDEIKAAFVNRVTSPTYNALYISYGGGAGDSVYVCYSPQSGSFTSDAQKRCSEELGTLPTEACDGTCADLTGASGDSDWCVCLP
ncbi:MAG: type II secretion system protein [Patescibacteria group bacterium]|jgi:prepilin-type N-terminal cleavage/methylation domain-containing protein